MSSMMEQEIKTIQKIKDKQRKEIEQMVDYEVKMNQIRAKNANNMKIQADKDTKLKAEVERKRMEYQKKKEQDQLYRQIKTEAEQKTNAMRA